MKKKKRTSYRPHGGRLASTIIPIISLTVLTILLAGGLAGVWQLFDPVDYQPPDVNPFAKNGTASSVAVTPAKDGSIQSSKPEVADRASSSSAPTSSTPPSDSASTAESSSPAQPGELSYQVAKGDWTPSEYFDDAIFVGDSLTEGIKHYDVMSNTTVLAGTGVNLDSIYTKQVIKTGEGDAKVSIMDALAAASPAKVYIMMGANSLDYAEEDFLRGYSRIVDSVKQMHPNATIYVQSIMPVTAAYGASRPNFANDRIDAINVKLSQMAQEKGVYFVNTAQSVKGADGALPAEASSDGIHFGTTYYRMWFDYLREHTVAN